MTHTRFPLYLFAFSASVILSAWCAYNDTVINPDGICYLMSAQALADMPLKEVMQLCPQSWWPFYPMLIHALAKISSLSYTVSAYTLNGFCSGLSVIAFLMITKELGGTARILWLAAFTILLPHDFNGLRQSIVRDHGYWACYLWSIWFLLRYMQKPAPGLAVSWSLSLLIAALFRKEAAVFIAAVPLCCWIWPGLTLRQRLSCYMQLNLLAFCLLLLAGSWMLLHPQAALAIFGKLYSQWQHFILVLTNRYIALNYVFSHYAMVAASKGDITLVIWLVSSMWYLLNVINTLGWIYAALVVYAWYIIRPANRVLIAYILINFLITFVFQLEREFLSKRYVMAMSLTMMLLVPFALDDLWQRYRPVFAAAVFAILVFALGGIFPFGYPKTFIHQAGDWIAANVPANASVYANDYQLMYYSQHFGRGIFAKIREYTHIETIAQDKWKQFDYLALRLSKSDPKNVNAIVKDITIPPLRVFQNKRGDRVAIYDVKTRSREK